MNNKERGSATWWKRSGYWHTPEFLYSGAPIFAEREWVERHRRDRSYAKPDDEVKGCGISLPTAKRADCATELDWKQKRLGWWRRRESNPRPRMLLAKRLHA